MPARALRISVLINLVLLAVVVYQARRFRDHLPALSSPGPQSATDASVTPNHSSSSAAVPAQTEPSPELHAPTVNWSNLESADYNTYIANLRTLGCPEQTIRDIITADVAQTFSRQRAEILSAGGRDFHYWNTKLMSPETAATIAQQKTLLDGRVQATLNELLGPDADLVDTTSYWRASERDWKLSFLPESVRSQVVSLDSRYRDVNAEIKSLTDWKQPSKSPAELQDILASYEERRTQLAQLLTPEQFKQYDMVTSFTSDNLRRAMANFDPSPEEFQIIFDAWRAHDENLARLRANNQPDPGNAHVYEKIRQALGNDRFNQYRSTWWK